MPKFTVAVPRVGQVALEEENAFEDVEVSFQMFLDQDRTGRLDQLVAVEGDQDWAWGKANAGGKGAVVLVNNDDDDGKKTRDCDDDRVNSAKDKKELAPLHVRFRGVPDVPDDWQAWIKVDLPDKLRIFASDADDAQEIVGPGTGAEVELSNDQKNACRGNGELKLRMEALQYAGPGFQDGLVKITFRVKGTGGQEKTDSAKVRVAPWMIPHHGIQAFDIFVVETSDNNEFRTALDGFAFMSGGCVLRTLKPATEATPANSEEFLDVGKCYGMRELLAHRNNYQTILQAAIIKTPVDYYYNETVMTMADVASHCRPAIGDNTPMTKGELLNYDGGSGESNRDFLNRKGNLLKGWIKVPGFWYVDDLAADALDRLAERFLDPPATLQEMFEWEHAGRTNADRLLVPNQRVKLPAREDRWMQDCMEIGYSSLPGQKINAVMRAPRNRPLRSIAPGLLGEDFGYHAPGTPRRANTFDSNGNLEVTPPCTSQGGKVYPWGRIYYGPGRPRQLFDPDVKDFLKHQKVQEPIEVDSAWLAVGHVDEMISWVPAPVNALRATFPYRLLVTSPALAMDILSKNRHSTKPQKGIMWRYASMPPQPSDAGEQLTLGGRKAGSLSIDGFLTGGMGSHKDFKAWQDEVQLKVDAVVTQLKTETGVQDNEIIKVPILYEKTGEGHFEALTAAMVNMLVVNNHCIIPKPFGPIVDGVDLFQKDLDDKLTPLGLTPHWLDDWYEYHDLKGEVHCGTNTLRNPPAAAWWEFVP